MRGETFPLDLRPEVTMKTVRGYSPENPLRQLLELKPVSKD
jgi:hypothetical protein